jgi:ribosome-associated translation inhibitor RaiA
MKIEFQTPFKGVPENLVKEISAELMKLSHLNKSISLAYVLLKTDDKIIGAENKICEIKLTVFAEAITAKSRTENFSTSAKETMKELKRMVMQQVKRQQQPQEDIVSSVKV